MEKVRVNKAPAWFIWTILAVGVANLFVGAFQLSKFYPELFGTRIQGIFTLCMGIIFLANFILLKRQDRFFVKQEGDQIAWFLEGMKQPASVQKKDIKEFDISWKGIDMKTNQSGFTISFKNYEWEQGKQIREAFKAFAS